MGSSPWCGKVFFSQSPSSADSFRASVQPTSVQSHASRAVRMLKIPNTGSHTIVLDTWKYYTDWQEWVVLLLQLLCLTQVRQPKFPARDKEVLKKTKKQKREGLVDSTQYLQNKLQSLLTDDEKYWLQSNEASYTYLNAAISLRSLCIPPVSTVPHGGQNENLWGSQEVGLRALSFTHYCAMHPSFGKGSETTGLEIYGLEMVLYIRI